MIVSCKQIDKAGHSSEDFGLCATSLATAASWLAYRAPRYSPPLLEERYVFGIDACRAYVRTGTIFKPAAREHERIPQNSPSRCPVPKVSCSDGVSTSGGAVGSQFPAKLLAFLFRFWLSLEV